MYDANIPIIRMEIEGMKRTIHCALLEHAVQMDEDIKNAVDEYCTSENIKRIIKEATYKQLDAAIKEELRHFFWNGPGRKAVAAAVKESILKNETYTPLDDIELGE